MARQDKANKKYRPARNDRMDCTGEYLSVSGNNCDAIVSHLSIILIILSSVVQIKNYMVFVIFTQTPLYPVNMVIVLM